MGAATIPVSTDRVMGFLTPILGRMVPPEPFSLPGDIGNQSRVLVIDSGDLTEILFASPILSHLKQRFPRMRMTFLVREGNSELVRAMGFVNEMITYEAPHLALTSSTYLTLIKRIRAREFNVALLLGSKFNLARSLLALVTRAPIRVGFSSEFTFPFVNCEVRATKRTTYEGSRLRSLFTAFGVNGSANLPAWRLPEHEVRWAKQMLHFHKPQKDVALIAVDPGMGKGRHRLVDESFAYLVNHLGDRMRAKVLVLSNNLDRKGLDKFRQNLQVDLFGLEPTNAKEGLALLSQAALLLAGNTDYFHFAVGMHVPTIGLFTRHDGARWFPKGTPWVQVLQGVRGQQLSLEEFDSKIDTILHLTSVV